MARIPDAEIDRLKLEVSLVRLVEASGVTLKAHGKDRIGRCPFHDDKTPSLVVSPKSNLWHCLGACQAGGSVIDWVMRSESISFREAVERLRQETGVAPPTVIEAPPPRMGVMLEDDQTLLRRVLDYYHATLQQSPEALAYLEARGLTHPDLIESFQLGFANRTLGYQLPDKNVKAGATIRGALERMGVYRDSGHEHFNGSLVIPVITPDGAITELYGRKVTRDTKLRAGTPLHLYLPGPHRGVFNEAGLIGQEEVILCEALIDALTFWCAGYRNVTSSYGIEGFTDDILTAFHRHGIKRVLIAYDADEAGNSAAEKLSARLIAEGFDTYRCRFPKGMDANAYAVSVQPASKSLGLVIRQAEWLGNGQPPQRTETVPMVETPAVPAELPSLVAASAPETDEAAAPELPAHRVPPSVPPVPVEIVNDEVRITLGDRGYVVRGVEKNLSYEQLKVWIKATCGSFVHIDTVELYAAKQRGGWIKQASAELGISEEAARSDLAAVLRVVEQRQDELIRQKLKPAEASSAPTLTPDQHNAGLTLLRDPDLIERIVRDVEATGVVGEASNALVAYLACVSRKLEKPLAILIQSTSAAGKSTLMDALLALMPESERVHYSAMTGQSLFYLGETSMKHKILAIAEEEGVRQAAYALKVLQSQGELTIASTGKDPTTGQLVTQEYRVEGPVMLFLTTTAIDIDEELLNRCLVLTINESREQTAAIQAKQRSGRTLEGLLAKARTDDLLAAHRAAQALLRPLAVVNPFAEQLTFASDRVRLRRDHAKYLALIDSIALLHQYQRPVRSVVHGGKTVEYIEVSAADIALANRLAHDVLGRSLDELPPPTRRLLSQAVAYVDTCAQAQAIPRTGVRFTRRALREHTGLSEAQVRVHLDRLVELEYVLAHAGRNGQRFVYELVFDGDVQRSAPQLMGLASVGTTVNLAAGSTDLVGTSWPARGDLVATSRTIETARIASVAAGSSSLVAAVEQNAPLTGEKTPSSYRNGVSYPLPPVVEH
ncbi:CHC2 zinc finger domain-containing protein [Tahibacter amnicola]|uniref:CHC2 zinc finger domain-containing protein n=1 Tax=Tahibacter amnicola TaxID=2976241 RepID=A0ABY6BE34_9GAMM|nr:CHC2 zinc finger domain-containing protein [Tahibacter amnicola]UXI68064.1 CHC2 zinc finger domain-containing protein [Tahibacter amnicola]UXI68070.1 CHC2 zinc finger domain-containing protein [Tahibacter amnicola]